MAAKLIRVSSVSTALLASAGFYVYVRRPDLNDLSVVRFGRAAVTVSGSAFSVSRDSWLHFSQLDQFLHVFTLRHVCCSPDGRHQLRLPDCLQTRGARHRPVL